MSWYHELTKIKTNDTFSSQYFPLLKSHQLATQNYTPFLIKMYLHQQPVPPPFQISQILVQEQYLLSCSPIQKHS